MHRHSFIIANFKTASITILKGGTYGYCYASREEA